MSRYTLATMSRMKLPFPNVRPFHHHRFLSGNSLQNVLVRQLDFPSSIRPGDHVAEYWSHRLTPGIWEQAMGCLLPSVDGDQLPSTDASFMRACQFLVGRNFLATGGIMVRFSDARFPLGLVRITIVGVYDRSRSLYSDNDGPHVRDPGVEASELDRLPSGYADALPGGHRLLPPCMLVGMHGAEPSRSRCREQSMIRATPR